MNKTILKKMLVKIKKLVDRFKLKLYKNENNVLKFIIGISILKANYRF